MTRNLTTEDTEDTEEENREKREADAKKESKNLVMKIKSIHVMIDPVKSMKKKKNAKSPSKQKRKLADWRTDPRSDDELFTRALGKDADQETWDAICVLHFRGTKVIHEKAVAWCEARSPLKRERGVVILSQLGIPKRRLLSKSVAIWLDMLKGEKHPWVLQSLGVAFYHNPNPKSIPALLRLRKHKSTNVRDAVVRGLMTLKNPRAIAAEIELSRDRNKGIRDWATFAIGSQIDTNTRKIREALAARLNDSDDDTRAEAIVGLAQRKDPRAFPYILKDLSSDNPDGLFLEAAGELGDSRFLPVLRKLRDNPDQGAWGKIEGQNIRRAIAKCKSKENK